TVSSISFEKRILHPEPTFPAFKQPTSAPGQERLVSNEVTFRSSLTHIGDFTVEVSGRPFAVGNRQQRIGYVVHGLVKWLEFPTQPRPAPTKLRVAFVTESKATDEEGAIWTFRQTITRAKTPNAFSIKTQVSVNRERSVVYLPLLLLHPGAGSFGKNKEHAL